MGLIREPLNVDFVVDPRPLTKGEEQAISDFIRMDKQKRLQKEQRRGRGVKGYPNNSIQKRHEPLIE